MDVFIGKGKENEHEAFLATWLSVFVFPVPQITLLVKSSLFPIAIHLARGNPIALGPAVLATIYKDLRLFKGKIEGLNKCLARGEKLPLVLNVQSPFYLVQVWVWERFKNLQPKPKSINIGDPLLLKWKLVKALQINNVRLALDSAIDDFIWRPYVNQCGMFYPKDEILVPFQKDLLDKHKHMLSFVTYLRVSELVGFESIEQYLPHRVGMQFGMDQDVPGDVSRFNETNAIAWENYCKPFSDTSLYFPSRFMGNDDGSKTCNGDNIIDVDVASVQDGMEAVGNIDADGGIIVDDDVPSGSIPKLLKTTSSENSVEDGLIVEKNVDADAPLVSVEDGLIAEKDVDFDAHSSLPPKDNTLTPLRSVEDGLIAEKDVDPDAPSLPPTMTPLISVEDCDHVLEDVQFEDYANEINEARLSSDTIGQSENQTESYCYLSKVSVAELEEKISGLEKAYTELKKQRLGVS